MKHHANALGTESHKNHLNTVNVWTSDVFKMLLRERQTIAQTLYLSSTNDKTGTEGKASNASCTPASLTSHIAGPWSPRRWWSPGPSAETAGQVTQRQMNRSKERPSRAYIVLDIWLHADGANDLLSSLHSQVIIQVEDGLLPVGVRRLWACRETERW